MINISFFQRYLHYPKSWAHKLSVSNKIFTSSVIFCMLPLTSNLHLSTEAILFVFTHLIYNWRNYCRKKLFRVMIVYSFIILIVVITDRSSSLYLCINVCLQMNYKMPIVYPSLPVSLIKDKSRVYFFAAMLPSLSIRSFSVIMIYSVVHNIIEYSTRYENILLQNSYYISILGLKTTILEELKLITILAYYFIHNNEEALRSTTASIYVKGFNFNFKHSNKKMYLILLLLYLKIIKTINNTLGCARIIYSKELLTEHKEKWLLR
uniref:Ycf92 n=1 Tax=Palmaria decipiens TaxID=187399 RepID=A0A6C0W1Q2_PALDE|nr:Ycf92 [Palmaria decipiens]QIC19589.1 Ycf92 [Palmaria decipiens]